MVKLNISNILYRIVFISLISILFTFISTPNAQAASDPQGRNTKDAQTSWNGAVLSSSINPCYQSKQNIQSNNATALASKAAALKKAEAALKVAEAALIAAKAALPMAIIDLNLAKVKLNRNHTQANIAAVANAQSIVDALNNDIATLPGIIQALKNTISLLKVTSSFGNFTNGLLTTSGIDPCDTGPGNGYFFNNGYSSNDLSGITNWYDGTTAGDPDGDIAGGTILTTYFESWWQDRFLKALRAQTSQINATRIEQTKQIGIMFDGDNIKKGTSKQEREEVKAKKANAPSEQICIAGSNAVSLAKTSSVANALTKNFKADMTKRSINATGSSSSTGPVADQKARWDSYCSVFHDPDNNNGLSSCPNPTTKGTVMNADIDIENFLLSDTIDMTDPDKVKASVSILQNLVQPTIKERIKDSAVNTLTGKEWLLKKQHIESIRNIATDVIASMISRRASVTGTNSGPLIKPIRENAGIETSKISNNPSYNEIMLALTKERFFDPNYFIKAQSSVSSIKQEETSIDSYINIQLRDIYRLQEQINLLLASRAAMKFNADPKSQQLQAAPLSN